MREGAKSTAPTSPPASLGHVSRAAWMPQTARRGHSGRLTPTPARVTCSRSSSMRRRLHILVCNGIFRSVHRVAQAVILDAAAAAGGLEGLRRLLSDPLGRPVDPARPTWHAHCGLGPPRRPARRRARVCGSGSLRRRGHGLGRA